jgi:ribosome recycling factor
VIDDLLKEAEVKMHKSLEVLQHELSTIRTGRATPGLIDRVQVDYYGTPTPLQQLAQIHAPEPRMLVIQPYDRNSIAAIEKSLQKSELGLNPANDGQVIRIPFPPLTEDRRKDLVKVVRHRAEEARIAIRNIRRDELHGLQELEKAGDVSKDDAKTSSRRSPTRTSSAWTPRRRSKRPKSSRSERGREHERR